MPRNTSASVLLTLLPELLQRPGNFLMSNYDIQVEGMSVGKAVDVALYQMQMMDIEKIEVVESPLSSYQNNGQGGSINIVLRSAGKDNKRTWGSAGVMVSSPLDVEPQFNVGYRNKRFMVRGIFLSELYNATSEEQTISYDGDMFRGQTDQSSDKRFRTELARAYMQYDITDHDIVKFNVSETYTYDKNQDTQDFDILQPLLHCEKALNVQALLNYKHQAKRNTFLAEVKYDHAPSWVDYSLPLVYSYSNSKKNDIVSGKLEYKNLLWGNANGGKGELALGTNFNATMGSEAALIDDAMTAGGELERGVPQNDSHYLMPYLTFITTIGKLGIKASGEYQHFCYDVDRIGIPYSATSNDFTGKLMVEWNFTKSRTLRLILDRKLQRPTYDQLYPYRTFDVKRKEYTEGNPDLTPTMVHEASLEYIGTYKLGDSQSLILNAGASISRIDDIISEVKSAPHRGQGFGLTQQYTTFENRGTNHITKANLMALYTGKVFSLSFTGNVYHKELDESSSNRHHTYYNLSLFPYFHLKDGWHGGARFTYFSRVDQSNGSLGDFATCEMTVGREMKRLFVYLKQRVTIMPRCKDIAYTGNLRTERKYNMLPNGVGIGVKYSF